MQGTHRRIGRRRLAIAMTLATTLAVGAAPGSAWATSAGPATSGPATSGSSGCTTVDCVVDNVIPGATTSETAESPTTCGGRGTDALDIRLPASFTPPTARPDQLPYLYESIGWRGLLAASVASTFASDISGYALSYNDGSVPAAAEPEFTSCLSPLLLADADALHQSLARRQMRVNFRGLLAALPAGSVLRHRISIVDIDRASNRYAIQIQLRLRQLRDLSGRVGDAVDGLLAGFGHAGADSLTEGVGIEVYGPSGLIAANWTSNRSGKGLLLYSAQLHVTHLHLTRHFAVVDGGPPAEPSPT